MKASNFKVVKFEHIDLTEPTLVSIINEDGDEEYLSLKKEALKYIYGKNGLGISLSTSKELFDADTTKWSQIISQQSLREELPIPFSLSEKYAVVMGDSIIALYDKDVSGNIEYFMGKVGEHVTYLNNNGIIRLTTNNGIHVDLNYEKGKYSVAHEIDYDGIGVITSRVQYFNSFLDLISQDIEYEHNLLVSLSESAIHDISFEKMEEIKLSARELCDIAKICKIKFETDKNGIVADEQTTDDKLVSVIASGFSKFKIPYKSIKKMGYVDKSMRLSDVSVYDVVELLFADNSSISDYISNDLINYIMYDVYTVGGDMRFSNK